MTGSNTGPRDFQLQYSTDGTTFTNFQSITVPGVTWNSVTHQSASDFSFDLGAIVSSGLLGQSTVYFRFTDASTTSIVGGTVGTAGTYRIDDVSITAS
jgi:hypothetical protein